MSLFRIFSFFFATFYNFASVIFETWGLSTKKEKMGLRKITIIKLGWAQSWAESFIVKN